MAKSARPSTDSRTAPMHVALLRGVNLGGKNRLAMKDLADLFAQAGCESVQTYIQSGNVVFCADAAKALAIATMVSRLIETKKKFAAPMAVRTLADMQRIARSNPFLKSGIDADFLHVMFLVHKPSHAAVQALDQARSSGDSFVVRDREIYLHLPNGAARTKLTAGYFDSRLKTICTQRNWRTVTALLALMQS